ncbi:hypothetical protein ACH4Q6_27035 [Streptomyces lydicus]|uniref:hypothetical protein n=1 Tax=Streptomyces lydicus TaxID=47763 RepID=UPI00379454AC
MFLLLAQGFGRTAYVDTALVLAASDRPAPCSTCGCWPTGWRPARRARGRCRRRRR